MKPTYKSYNQVTYLYTKGKEYMLGLEEYIGEYHIQQNSPWTGPVASADSLPLSTYVEDKNVVIYDLITGTDARNKSYLVPYDSFDTPNKNQYTTGIMNRYFMRRRNDPYKTIMEVSAELGRLYNKPNGVNSVLYEMVEVRWSITNNPEDAEKVIRNNIFEIQKANEIFPGISQYFTSAFEYSYEII